MEEMAAWPSQKGSRAEVEEEDPGAGLRQAPSKGGGGTPPHILPSASLLDKKFCTQDIQVLHQDVFLSYKESRFAYSSYSAILLFCRTRSGLC